MKLCTGCKHMRPGRFGKYTEECWRSVEVLISLVDGSEYATKGDRDCRSERRAKWNIWWLFGDRECGKEGRFWEAKE